MPKDFAISHTAIMVIDGIRPATFFCFERTPTQVMLGDVRRRSHTPDDSTTHARRCTDTTTGDAPKTPGAQHCVAGPNGPATSVRLVHRRTT